MSYSLSTILPYIFTLILFLLFLEQFSYLLKKGKAKGPAFVLPFLGNAIHLVRNPTKFWDTQSALSTSSGFSVNYLLGRFIVYIRDSDLSRLIFSNVRPDAFHLIGHPFGKKLFGEHNMIYMFGQKHKDLRRRIAPNFTPKALSTYMTLQQIIILKHLKKWDQLSLSTNPLSLRILARDMNLETSQRVFVGPYLNREARLRFNHDYNLFNLGLMTLPFDLPGFAFRQATLAVDRLVKTLADCTRLSKLRMSQNQDPFCLADFWMQETLKEIAASGNIPSPYSSDAQIGGYLFDFLFAAQNASTSSLLWAVTLLESHPHVLDKVRREVSGIWSPDTDELITAEQVHEMKYTHAVAREVIRFSAPATLVPHIAANDFPLTENYKIPKGAIVFPSVYESCFQGFSEPEQFEPERFFGGLLGSEKIILSKQVK